MIILRKKSFADTPQQSSPQQSSAGSNDAAQEPMSARELQEQQLKLQRQLLQIQNQKHIMRVREDMAKRKQMTQMMRMESEEKQTEQRNQLKARSLEVNNGQPNNTSLYKTRSRIIDPVPMKI